MDNVEKAVADGFGRWREEKGRNETSGDELSGDLADYMEEVFQVKNNGSHDDANILDMLNTMVASDVETSVGLNGVRDNVIACDTADNGDDTTKLYIHAWWRAEAGSCEAARGGFWWMMDGEEEETSASCSIADLGTLHLPR